LKHDEKGPSELDIKELLAYPSPLESRYRYWIAYPGPRVDTGTVRTTSSSSRVEQRNPYCKVTITGHCHSIVLDRDVCYQE
jgi:hypothetical protein